MFFSKSCAYLTFVDILMISLCIPTHIRYECQPSCAARTNDFYTFNLIIIRRARPCSWLVHIYIYTYIEVVRSKNIITKLRRIHSILLRSSLHRLQPLSRHPLISLSLSLSAATISIESSSCFPFLLLWPDLSPFCKLVTYNLPLFLFLFLVICSVHIFPPLSDN